MSTWWSPAPPSPPPLRAHSALVAWSGFLGRLLAQVCPFTSWGACPSIAASLSGASNPAALMASACCAAAAALFLAWLLGRALRLLYILVSAEHGSSMAFAAGAALRELRRARPLLHPPAPHTWTRTEPGAGGASSASSSDAPPLCGACTQPLGLLGSATRVCASCGVASHEACRGALRGTCRPQVLSERGAQPHSWTVAGTSLAPLLEGAAEGVGGWGWGTGSRIASHAALPGLSASSKAHGPCSSPRARESLSPSEPRLKRNSLPPLSSPSPASSAPFSRQPACLLCRESCSSTSLASEPTWVCACCGGAVHVQCAAAALPEARGRLLRALRDAMARRGGAPSGWEETFARAEEQRRRSRRAEARALARGIQRRVRGLFGREGGEKEEGGAVGERGDLVQLGQAAKLPSPLPTSEPRLEMDSGSQSDSSASSEDVFDSAKTLAAHLKRRRRKARTLHPEALHLCAGHPLVAHMVLPPAAVCVSQTRHREEREQAGAEERKQAGAEERKQAGAEEQEQAGAEERKQDVEKNFSPSQDAKGRNESQREKESLLGNKSSPKPQTPHAEIVSHAVNEEDEAPTPPPRAPAALPPDAAAPTRSETAPRPDYTLRSETEPKPDCTLRSETEPKPDCTLRSVAPSSSRARWSVEASWWRRRLREAITSRSHARCRLEAAQLPPRARPLLVFVSTRSGAQEGAALRLRLLRLLHPLQVVELPQQDPLRALELFAHLPGLRVLVAGGDGTVSWILSALDLLRTRVESERKGGRGGREEGAEGGERNGCGQGDAAPHVQAWRPPPVGILPMGTGNDLARVLQWGAGAGAWAGLSATKVLCEADSAAVSLLDRWHLELEEEEQPGGAKGQGGACDAEAVAGRDSPPRDPPSRPDGSQPPQNAPTSPTVPSSIPRGLAAGWRLADAAAASLRRPRDIPTMTNYLGVGTDAMVALDFHRLRESFPGWFRSQWGNKIVYGLMATLDALRAVRSPPDLRDAVELECDGELVPLPPGMQGLILLNIHSFMGGVDLWGQGRGTGRPPAGRPEEWRSPSPAGRAMDACPSGTSLSRARSEQLPWSRHGNGAPSTKEPCSASPVPRPAASGSAADPFSQASPAPAPGALGPQLAWDGRLEVLAVRGALHLGAARVGLSEPLRLRQCARARLRFRKALPMQVDGEAWVQGPGTIAVRRESQARMLRRVAQPLARVVRAAQDVLDASLAQGVVSAEQHALLSQQLTLRLMEALPST